MVLQIGGIINNMKYSFAGVDWAKIGRGAGVAVAGALLTYVTAVIPELVSPEYLPLVTAFWAVVVNVVRKFIAE